MSDEVVPNLRGGHFETLKWILGIVVAAASFFGGKVYEAGRWAEKSETERMIQARDHIRIDTLETASVKTGVLMDVMSKDITEIKLGMKDLAAQKGRARER